MSQDRETEVDQKVYENIVNELVATQFLSGPRAAELTARGSLAASAAYLCGCHSPRTVGALLRELADRIERTVQ